MWKASRILDQIERFEESKLDLTPSVGTTKRFDQIPSVPWLDAITKDHCEQVLAEAREAAEVCFSCEIVPVQFRCPQISFVVASCGVWRRKRSSLFNCRVTGV